MRHEFAVSRILMTYSWHNIMPEYDSKTIKYSVDSGANWKTITFETGMYSYTDVDDYIHEVMKKYGDVIKDGQKETYGINLTFVLSTYKVVIESNDKYQLDLRNSKFGELIGFEPKLLTKSEYGSKLPNITNSNDVINVSCDAIQDSLGNGESSNTIAVIPTNNLTRSFPFLYQLRFLSYSSISTFTLTQIRFYITDSIGRPIDLNGIDWYIELFLKSIRK